MFTVVTKKITLQKHVIKIYSINLYSVFLYLYNFSNYTPVVVVRADEHKMEIKLKRKHFIFFFANDWKLKRKKKQTFTAIARLRRRLTLPRNIFCEHRAHYHKTQAAAAAQQMLSAFINIYAAVPHNHFLVCYTAAALRLNCFKCVSVWTRSRSTVKVEHARDGRPDRKRVPQQSS